VEVGRPSWHAMQALLSGDIPPNHSQWILWVETNHSVAGQYTAMQYSSARPKKSSPQQQRQPHFHNNGIRFPMGLAITNQTPHLIVACFD
jgi:hypothetical protein